jgi:dihydroxyacetone kinase phosphotransfer subunit
MSVGIVVISHSDEIASGLKKLLQQANDEVPIAACGGTDDGNLGTHAPAIKEAIDKVNAGEGVVLLFDIGSARMNAELAVEMSGNPENMVIADAPLIEGSYAAVVEAGMGKTVSEVGQAAEKARSARKVL